MDVLDVEQEHLLRLIDATKARSRTILQLAEQVAVRLHGRRIVLSESGEKVSGITRGTPMRLLR